MRRVMKSLGHIVEAVSCVAEFLAYLELVEAACLIADVRRVKRR
jgi:hypothetical protein